MSLKEIYRSFSANVLVEDFVVDEQPVEVWRDEEATGNAANGGPHSADFISQIGKILREHDQLSSLKDRFDQNWERKDEFEALIRRFLPLLDGFERLLHLARDVEQTEMVANWLKTIEGLYYRIRETLGQCGLSEIKSIGQQIDLDFHEVVGVKYTTEQAPDAIVAERQKGYVFRGKVIRDAQVIVATNETE
ncbi:nucleotide exchange factor GrpE [Candidatus Sumerlaeota bacterium]